MDGSPQRERYGRVTIQDVARACALAPSTVSNALAGKTYVRTETRERVVRIAAEMGYSASPLARGLRMNRSWSIGLVISDISNPSFAEVARGIEEVVIERGWHIIVANTDYDRDKEAKYLKAMRDHKVDGLALASFASDSDDVVDLHQAEENFVLLFRRHRRIQADLVGIDNRGGMIVAMDHLSGLGHRRIAVIRGPEDSTATDERFDGYLEGLKRARVLFDGDLIADGDLTMESGIAAMERLLALPEKPTAVLATNDFMAFGAMTAIMNRGLRIPEDMSVVGFDDIYVSGLPMVNLTTIHHPSREMGNAAAEILLKRIQAKRRPRAKEVIFEPRLVVRGTTAPPP